MRLQKLLAGIAIIVAAGMISGCSAARERARHVAGAQAFQDYDSTMPPATRTATYSNKGRTMVSVAGLPGPTVEPSGSSSSEGAKTLSLAALADSHPDRYLIKDATLTIEVKDARRASRMLGSAVEVAHGYVSDTHESVDALGRRSVTTKVRVPFTRFDASMQQIETLGKVLDKQITAEDVTEEFVDSQAKLRNLQSTESRLLEHLNRTGRLSDILLVEKELNRVRGEIEQLEGRLRFLEHRIAFSTISLTLSEAPGPQQVVPEQTYSSGKEASDAMRSLVAFLQVAWTAAIWIAIWAVVWVPFAVVVWLVYRRRASAIST